MSAADLDFWPDISNNKFPMSSDVTAIKMYYLNSATSRDVLHPQFVNPVTCHPLSDYQDRCMSPEELLGHLPGHVVNCFQRRFALWRSLSIPQVHDLVSVGGRHRYLYPDLHVSLPSVLSIRLLG